MPSSLPDNLQIRWLHSLRFALLIGNVLLAIIVGGAALLVNQQTLEKPLSELNARMLASEQQRVFDSLANAAAQASQFSLALNALAQTQWGQEQNLRQLGEALLSRIAPDSAIVAAGIWPEPNSFNPQRIRNSFYWTLDRSGDVNNVEFHGDYNNPDNISYHGELWYQPTRSYQGKSCHWTHQYAEPFLRRSVVSCAIPVYRNKDFLGVTSLVLDLQRLQLALPGNDSQVPFYLLLDAEQGVLSAQGITIEAKDTLPSVAQRDKRFGPIAVHLMQLRDQRTAQASAANSDWQARVNSLVDSTRDLSRLQAEQILERLLHKESASSAPVIMNIDDGSLNKTAVQLRDVPGLGTLIVGQLRPPALAGLPIGLLTSVATTAGAIAIALLFSYVLASRITVAPLRRLLTQLQRPAEDTVLEFSGQNEVSALMHLFNVRHERIRILIDRMRAQGVDTGKIPRSTQVTAKPTGIPASDASAWNVLDAFADSVVITDAEGKVRHLNAAAETLSGVSLAQAAGQSFDEVFHIMDRRGKNRLAELATRAIKAGRRSERPLQAMLKTRSGHELPIAISSSPLATDGAANQGAMLILHDARTASAGAPAQAQVRDALTGTLNRQAFDLELASRCEATRLGGEQPFSLLYIDVDHMQQINDAFGTDGGDEFLRQLSRLIQSDVGDGNPVYRLQGDKFATLLATDDSAEAQVTAELLRADVQSWGFQWNGEKRDVSISASLLQVDRNSGRPVDILRNADELCQQAQTEGRGRVLTGQANPSRNIRRDDKSWLTNIKRGLTEDRFHLSTQQLKSLQRNSDQGGVFDTFLLLEDEEGFWTGASTFMPVAERNDMAVQLDRWTIGQIFSRLSDDADLVGQLDFCLIPISASSMQAPQFLDFLVEQLKDSQIQPSKICLDLKEHDVHTRLSSARDFCMAITRVGCRVSLSEVSTRPSSYSLIKELPASLIRFDPILTRHADKDPVDRLATESLHRIVHTLGKQSLVTQINSPELLRIVQGIGVDYAQGDAVSRVTPILFQAKT